MRSSLVLRNKLLLLQRERNVDCRPDFDRLPIQLARSVPPLLDGPNCGADEDRITRCNLISPT